MGRGLGNRGWLPLLPQEGQCILFHRIINRLGFEVSCDHLEIIIAATGINITHVPYKGGILAVTDLVGGQIDMVFSDMVPAMPQIKGGKLRALAVTSERRSPAVPDVPTMVEAGMKEPIPETWWAMLAPKGTPPAIINRLNADLAQIMKLPDVQERYADLGIFTSHTTPERVMELVNLEGPHMGKVLKAAGVEPD